VASKDEIRVDTRFLIALHKEIADRLANDEAADLLERARDEVQEISVKATRRRWRTLLNRPPNEIAAALRSQRLYGVLWASPFVDALTRVEAAELSVAAEQRLAAAEEAQRGRRHGKTKVESKLARLRIERGWTQAEMAEYANLAPKTYWKLERRQIPNPPVGYLAACARVLKVPLEEVVEDELLQWGAGSSTEKRS
jgi:DNA-binding XRE family transcriptional regulator